jgi:hypothetical protein
MSTTFKYGLLAAFGYIAYMLLAWFYGLNSYNFDIGYFVGYATILIPIAAIYLALKERRKLQKGWLALREGIGTSFQIGLVMAIFTTLFMSVYITKIQPDYVEIRKEHERTMIFNQAKIKNPNWTDEHARDIAVSQVPDTSQGRMLVSYGLLKLSTALMVGLVLTFFIRREKPPQDQPQRTDSSGTPISSSS